MLKYLIIVMAVMAVILLAGCCGTCITSVGGKPSREDRADYKKRASNYDGKTFYNEKSIRLMQKTEDNDPLRMSKNKTAPDHSLPEKIPQLITDLKEDDFTVTWFGHSTVLVQMHGMNILFDPVFTERISPVSWAGPKKFAVKNFDLKSLPEIDILILSHDHYDHLDYQCIKALDNKVKKYIVPLGVECHLRRWKIDQNKVTNLAWWENTQVNGLTVTATPAQHFSGRWITGRNETLWNGYVLKDQYRQIFESGDSGNGDHYKTIHEKFGDFDLAMMECGQYNVRWPDVHSFPEETAEEAKTLGAKVVMPVHWGSIVLSSNGWDDSVLRFIKKANELNLTVVTPYLCQTVNLDNISNFQENWWADAADGENSPSL